MHSGLGTFLFLECLCRYRTSTSTRTVITFRVSRFVVLSKAVRRWHYPPLCHCWLARGRGHRPAMTTVLRWFRLTRLCREHLRQYFGELSSIHCQGQQTMPSRTVPLGEARPSFPTAILLASYLFISASSLNL